MTRLVPTASAVINSGGDLRPHARAIGDSLNGMVDVLLDIDRRLKQLEAAQPKRSV